MIQFFKISLASAYLETVSFFRVKESFFFSFVFPVFIFVLFGTIWGDSYSYYIPFLLSGVIGMTIASDAMFSIGPVIRLYHTNNVIKFLRNLPMNILSHFFGMLLSRILALGLAIFLVSTTAALIFKFRPSMSECSFYMVGSILGVMLFSFLGLFLSSFSNRQSGRGFINLLFFVMIFLSGCFYPVQRLPVFLQHIAQFLPLTHLLEFIRQDTRVIWYLIGWILLFMILFYFVFYKKQILR
ncbi:ABC transporter permease [candidate division KSB1 bacterium]|nr:ABC transporter permease [candidate division KSB1 bacterium]RQW01825.1 MAG: ABC transporter permease [candidate division KSB1 bacterium]